MTSASHPLSPASPHVTFRLIPPSSSAQPEWATITKSASAIYAATVERARAATRRGPELELLLTPTNPPNQG